MIVLGDDDEEGEEEEMKASVGPTMGIPEEYFGTLLIQSMILDAGIASYLLLTLSFFSLPSRRYPIRRRGTSSEGACRSACRAMSAKGTVWGGWHRGRRSEPLDAWPFPVGRRCGGSE